MSLSRRTAVALTLSVCVPLVPVLFAASPASAASTEREGETFSLPASAGTAVSDANASGGRDLLVWGNGTATAPLTLAGTAGKLTIRALGDQCQGAPVMDLVVDGRALGSRTVSATAWTTYTYPGTWAPGTHTVSVGYNNDLAAGGCDRNLRLDKVGFVADTATPPPAPTTSRAFGLSENDGSNRGLGGALATAAAVGHHLDEFNFYMAWEYQEAFPTADVQAIANAGALPSITWEPWQPGAGSWQGKYSLDTINNGSWDWYIDSWARAAASFGRPMKLRFAHEMNGNWYPWDASVNGNTPGKYIAAYRRVHDRFVAAGARNVSWVWSMNIVDGMPTPISQLYPGDGYVDAIGIDGYNGGTDNPGMGGWHSPAQVFGNTLVQLGQVAPAKPVYLAETGSAVGGGDKAAWTRDLFTYLKGTNVKGVDWFQFGGFPDWRITSSSSVTDAARAALSTW